MLHFNFTVEAGNRSIRPNRNRYFCIAQMRRFCDVNGSGGALGRFDRDLGIAHGNQAEGQRGA